MKIIWRRPPISKKVLLFISLCFLVVVQYIYISGKYAAHLSRVGRFVSKTLASNYDENCTVEKGEQVKIEVYYESLCPFSKDLYVNQLLPIAQELGDYVQIVTYPYGNAQTNTVDGELTFKCQHGKKECHGNQLQACALEYLKDYFHQCTNSLEALKFNACLMDKHQFLARSDDATAEQCGEKFGVDYESIINCASTAEGLELHAEHGRATKRYGITFVPYVRVNDRLSPKNDLWHDVCSRFKTKPDACLERMENKAKGK